ncbi:hypothetical protein [Paenibacillus mendelii]|uniref:Uncharacterized protein n=1 Tax=Paenibacillus mendelii TaxID=206163 RepID=A0ABV6JC85_9BACL|nr:hypothetical protein [Paenibacillus mendelii]MCQ6561523.1 hypothetical protein [Paenibacillus mendelii]
MAIGGRKLSHFFETQAYELVIEKKQDLELVFHHEHAPPGG